MQLLRRPLLFPLAFLFKHVRFRNAGHFAASALSEASGAAIRSLVRDGNVQGLVIAGTGLGNVTGLMFDAIQEARMRGIPVVISTRVPTGRIFPLNAVKGGALALKAIGCMLADNLSPQKARILLM